ncbi:MAG: hypothetical protein J1F03_00255 [Oscillospiraceae bacterium]|nr:hypothetical protein [Oscillospiraceae bacterium]
MENLFYNHHYIKIRSDGVIINGWSDGTIPEKDTSNAICINDRGGYQFRLFPDGEENPPIRALDGIPLYKWDGKRVVRRTDEEIEADRAAILNSPERRAAEIKQQLTALDNQAIRPLRAILAGTPTDDDKDKLREIEAQAVILRNELAELGGGD